MIYVAVILFLGCGIKPAHLSVSSVESDVEQLQLSWSDEILTISGRDLPGGSLEVWYIEAFCRPMSSDRDWADTVIPHQTRFVSAAEDRSLLRLRSILDDGVVVDHRIAAKSDAVEFDLIASNPTDRPSEVHWGQPCVRVDRFVGVPLARNSEVYLPSCFLFIDDRARMMPFEPWAKEARYTPGQVWGMPGVPRTDLNPRPISAVTPSSSLIGCYSEDRSQVLGISFEPSQELFQGVITCLHSDFRIGGLESGETKRIRGRILFHAADPDGLLRRHRTEVQRGSGPAKAPEKP